MKIPKASFVPDTHPYKNDVGTWIQVLLLQLEDVRSIILVAHGYLELLVSCIVDSKCKHAKRIKENGRDFSHSSKLILLSEAEHIDDDLFEELDAFRKLRNRAAHEPFFEISDCEFSSLGVKTKEDLRKRAVNLTAWLFSAHQDVLGPIFMPTMIIASPEAREYKRLLNLLQKHWNWTTWWTGFFSPITCSHCGNTGRSDRDYRLSVPKKPRPDRAPVIVCRRCSWPQEIPTAIVEKACGPVPPKK